MLYSSWITVTPANRNCFLVMSQSEAPLQFWVECGPVRSPEMQKCEMESATRRSSSHYNRYTPNRSPYSESILPSQMKDPPPDTKPHRPRHTPPTLRRPQRSINTLHRPPPHPLTPRQPPPKHLPLPPPHLLHVPLPLQLAHHHLGIMRTKGRTPLEQLCQLGGGYVICVYAGPGVALETFGGEGWVAAVGIGEVGEERVRELWWGELNDE